MALCRADRLDGLVALTTFMVTLMVGPERGILVGVAAAALCLLWRMRRVPVRERLWRPADASGPHGPACLVRHPCGGLLYPHAEAIRDEALRLALARGLPVVLDLSAAPFLDEDAAVAVRDLVVACGAAGLPVVFAETASGVLERMNAAGLVVSGLAFPTVDEAGAHAIAKAEGDAALRPAAPLTLSG
jgi:SulP family sulfate permease